MRNLLVGILLLLSLLSAEGATSFGLKPDGKLNQPAISRAYKESDWDQVIAVLESYLRRNPESRLQTDEKVFAFKYLGVIYAADTLTHTKAESYFNRLLSIAPRIEIVDMYPSKKILEFFREVRRDHDTQLSYSQQYDTYGQKGNISVQEPMTNGQALADSMPQHRDKSPQPIPKRELRENKKGSSWLWWAAGAAAVGAGVSVYVLTQGQPEKSKEHVQGDITGNTGSN